MRQIYFVRNNEVWEDISKQIDLKSVVAICNLDFFEKIPGNTLPDEIPLDVLNKFKNDDSGGGGDISAVIAVNTGAAKDKQQFSESYFFRLSLAVARTLKRNGIAFSFWNPFSPYLHVYGQFPNLSVEVSNDSYRNPHTLGLLQEVFQTFTTEFIGKAIDIWLAMDDECALKALDLAKALDLPYVFSYYTTYALKDRVIALPDYESIYNEKKFSNSINSNVRCKEAAKRPWQDNRVFWRGSLFTSFSRSCLFELGQKYPQYLCVEDSTKGQFIPMIAQTKYKYLLDTRGNAWSSRLQTLLKLGRVIFIADRPYRDWYFDRLKPMKHYVPIREDMSDLIEKVCYMEQHPEIYDDIVSNLKDFVEENLTPRRIVFEAKELILRYGTVK